MITPEEKYELAKLITAYNTQFEWLYDSKSVFERILELQDKEASHQNQR